MPIELPASMGLSGDALVSAKASEAMAAATEHAGQWLRMRRNNDKALWAAEAVALNSLERDGLIETKKVAFGAIDFRLK